MKYLISFATKPHEPSIWHERGDMDVWAKAAAKVKNGNQIKFTENCFLKCSLLPYADWMPWAAVQDNFRACNCTQLLGLFCHKADTEPK